MSTITVYTQAQVDTLLAAKQASGSYAPIASPTFTGDPKAPTPAYGDNDTSLATTAFVQAAVLVTANVRTANYTLALTDLYNAVEMNMASANTLTIPTNASVAFPVGAVIEILQYGAGITTIAGASGVTVRAPRGARIAVQYGAATIRKRATDEWVLNGDVMV